MNGKMKVTDIVTHDDGTSTINFFIDDDLYEQISQLSKERGQTVEEFILEAIDYGIAKNEKTTKES